MLVAKAMTRLIIPLLLIVFSLQISNAQEKGNNEIKELISKFKTDAKGPYKAIRWFCPDGSTVPPEQRCPMPGGVQRAQYKDAVIDLAKTNKIYLGQILSATNPKDFWDLENQHSRLKQYQIEKYLQLVDDGWINKRAKYYRGALQEEDEQNWGKNFLLELLADDKNITNEYYLIRSAAMDITHNGDNKNSEIVRAISKNLSDTMPSFMDIRVKIHGDPEQKDIESVIKFVKQKESKISSDQKKQFAKLIEEMRKNFAPIELGSLGKYLNLLSPNSEIKNNLNHFIESNRKKKSKLDVTDIKQLSTFMIDIRKDILKEKKNSARLALIDLSIAIENILFTEINKWQTKTVSQIIEKNYYLAQTLVGIGNLELWEWEKVKKSISVPKEEVIFLETGVQLNEASKRIIEWSGNTIRAVYEIELNIFSEFEPLVHGFIDNKIRSSMLLYYGNEVGKLNEYVTNKMGQKNSVLSLSNQNQIKGLNPGYAKGELVVIKGSTENINFSADKIYVFEKPISDLKPVAGLATVAEGNLVSHVQLLARNLGIPNSSMSQENLNDLLAYSGKKVFYAVSRKGTVILKLESEMNENEKNLFSVKKEAKDMYKVPTDKLKLDFNKVINLRKLKAKDSGVLCGPKAANLGQLKNMFPDDVVEGIVIPFGIFKAHMDQIIPGKSITYWHFLTDIFDTKKEMIKNGRNDKELEEFTLTKLKELRDLIIKMPLLKIFERDLENNFLSVLGTSLGTVGVFLRSDTNMEDLKDFTGAGLNLTLFNVFNKEDILKGIKQVWASPFSERSYKWRQRILENPENVYPSILIIPSVNVDNSGVMITTGVASGNEEDITIAFSRGPGGAVDGQATEGYSISSNGKSILLSPSRESKFNVLPSTGGVEKGYSSFNKSVLSEEQINKLLKFSKELKQKLPNVPGIESKGPFDVELGFKDSKIWLFQVRPFVESKKAAFSEYLNSLDSKTVSAKTINLNDAI